MVGAMLGSFAFHWRSGPPEHRPVARIVLADLPDAPSRRRSHRAVAIGGAGWRSRMLAPCPSNLKNPAWLAAQAEGIAGRPGSTSPVWDEKQLAADGFGGILGVGQASATPPRLIRLDYTPAQGRPAYAARSCWSARASPSTPAASPSSPARRWST